MPKTYQVIVVGAGPSGNMAAHHLAKAGFSVAIIEKELLPRYKTCGGGLVYRAIRQLPFDIRPIVEHEFCKVDFYLDGRHYAVERTKPIITLVMRDRFDYMLSQEAEKQGVHLYQGQALEELEQREDGVHIATTKEKFVCEYLIGADGAYSQVARLAGFEDRRVLIPALEYELWLRDQDLEKFSKQVRFDVGVVPYGYGWVFPKAHHLSVGIGHLGPAKLRLKKYYREYINRIDLKEVRRAEQHGFQIPIRPRGIYHRDRILLTGDAAGFADPVVAEGISHALRSGRLAAEALIQHFNSPSRSGGQYETEIRSQITKFYLHAFIAAKLFYKYEGFSRWIFNKRGEVLCNWFTDIFMGTKEYPDNVLSYLLSAWKLLKTKNTAG